MVRRRKIESGDVIFVAKALVSSYYPLSSHSHIVFDVAHRLCPTPVLKCGLFCTAAENYRLTRHRKIHDKEPRNGQKVAGLGAAGQFSLSSAKPGGKPFSTVFKLSSVKVGAPGSTTRIVSSDTQSLQVKNSLVGQSGTSQGHGVAFGDSDATTVIKVPVAGDGSESPKPIGEESIVIEFEGQQLRVHPDTRLIVQSKITGKKLAGTAAPRAKTLISWLKVHQDYELAGLPEPGKSKSRSSSGGTTGVNKRPAAATKKNGPKRTKKDSWPLSSIEKESMLTLFSSFCPASLNSTCRLKPYHLMRRSDVKANHASESTLLGGNGAF